MYTVTNLSILDNKISGSYGNVPKYDTYGLINGKQQISKGFLTTECAIQFKLFDDPIIFWAPKLQKKIVCVVLIR